MQNEQIYMESVKQGGAEGVGGVGLNNERPGTDHVI